MKYNPQGTGAAQFVRPAAIFYVVGFENVASANGAALQVEVIDRLDPNLDMGSLELDEIAFGGVRVRVPEGLGQFQHRLDVAGWTWNVPAGWHQGETPLGVDVEVMVEAVNAVRWRLTATDPATGFSPPDPYAGFLPPNDPSTWMPAPSNEHLIVHPGKGYVSYRIKPKPGLASGTVIRNQAEIIFDFNDPVTTPAVLNTIDAGAPSSQVAALPPQSYADFTVQWSGEDDAGGSGIAGFDVFVSDNGGAWALSQDATTDTSASFTGEMQHTYAFFTIARDHVGDIEPPPAAPDATVTVAYHRPVAGEDTVGRPPGQPLKIHLASLLADDHDEDGDTLSVVGVAATSASGVALNREGSWITYEPAPAFGDTDSFTYTVADGYGGESTATVTIFVEPPGYEDQPRNKVACYLLSEGSAYMAVRWHPGSLLRHRGHGVALRGGLDAAGDPGCRTRRDVRVH